MLWARTGETAQNRLCLRCAQAHRCGELDHQIIVLPDQLPVDRARQHELKVGVRVRFPCFWTVEFLSTNILEPWHQLETQQVAEAKSDFVLSMSIHKLLFDLHLGTMPQDTLDHRCYLRRRTRFELRVNTGGMLFNMPIQHHSLSSIA